MAFQLLPLELKYKIADHWTIAEIKSVLVHYQRPLDHHDTMFKNYISWRTLGITKVAQAGDLAGVIWLATNGANILDQRVIRYAARSGNLELVQWLYEHEANILDPEVIRQAAWSGTKELVQWLKAIRAEHGL